MTHLMSPLSPHFEINKLEVFSHFFVDKNQIIFCRCFSWNTVSIVEVGIFVPQIFGHLFWSKITQIGPNLTQIWEFLSSKILNFFPYFFYKDRKKLFWAKKSNFHHFYSLYDLPLPTQILFIFVSFLKSQKKIMSLWVWNGSHAADPAGRLCFEK